MVIEVIVMMMMMSVMEIDMKLSKSKFKAGQYTVKIEDDLFMSNPSLSSG